MSATTKVHREVHHAAPDPGSADTTSGSLLASIHFKRCRRGGGISKRGDMAADGDEGCRGQIDCQNQRTAEYTPQKRNPNQLNIAAQIVKINANAASLLACPARRSAIDPFGGSAGVIVVRMEATEICFI